MALGVEAAACTKMVQRTQNEATKGSCRGGKTGCMLLVCFGREQEAVLKLHAGVHACVPARMDAQGLDHAVKRWQPQVMMNESIMTTLNLNPKT
eukprot:360137-Chlamydomonas_euryale.AAC.6